MANIPIRDIPGAVVASPDPSNIIPMDNGSLMQKTTIANAVNATLPLASQAEAQAGADNVKRMSSLRTKQAIDAQTPTIVNTAITALNLSTMSQEDASDYTPTSGLAAVALSNDYADLSNRPSLGTMSQEDTSDYTKTSGLAAVALSNDYNDLDNLPTLGSAAATDASDYATAAQGSLASTAVQPGNATLVPAGGTTGQVLVKNSGTNYDTVWISPEAVGSDAELALQVSVNSLYIAGLEGTALGYPMGVVDAFGDETGVATKTNADYSAENDWYTPQSNSSSETVATPSTTASLADFTYVDRAYSLPNGREIVSMGCHSNAAISATIKIVREISSTTFEVVLSKSFSNPSGWADVTLDVPFVVPSSGTYRIAAHMAGSTSVASTRAYAEVAGNASGTFTASLSGTGIVVPTRYTWVTGYSNMTLVSEVFPLLSEPTAARVSVQTSETAPIVINDDLTAEISRDGGATWEEATLSLVSSFNGVNLYEDAILDLTDQPSGADFAWRVKTHNNVNVAVSGIVALGR